jgi:hypothetical protein
MKIYFGAAGAGEAYTRHSGETPDFFIDNDSSKWGTDWLGVKVLPPKFLESETNRINISNVVITSGYIAAILPQLLDLGVPRDKIVIPPKSWLGAHPFINEEDRVDSASFLSILMSNKQLNVVAAGGTALGFVRDSDFILWDFDFDLFADIAQREALVEALEDLACNPHYEGEGIKASVKLKSGLVVPFAIDFFDSSSDVYVDRYEDHCWEWPIAMFSNPKTILIHSQEVAVPNPPEVYLKGVYGESWQTPRPEFNYFDYGGLS